MVGVVIDVDTHVHTQSVAVLDTATGGVLEEVTVEATAEGNAELVGFGNHHATLRAWAIEGTSGHSGWLSRIYWSLRDRHRVGPPEAGCPPARSPTRSMRSVLPARRWSDHGWELPAGVLNAKPCRCCWLFAEGPGTSAVVPARSRRFRLKPPIPTRWASPCEHWLATLDGYPAATEPSSNENGVPIVAEIRATTEW
jgi:hypothetical protein